MSKAHKYWRTTVDTFSGIIRNLEANRNKAFSDYRAIKVKTTNDCFDRVDILKTLYDIECELVSFVKRTVVLQTVLFDTLHCVEMLFKRIKYDVDFEADDYDISSVIIKSCLSSVKIEFKNYDKLEERLAIDISYSKDGGFTWSSPEEYHVSRSLDKSLSSKYNVNTFIVKVLKCATTGSSKILRSNDITINEEFVKELLDS